MCAKSSAWLTRNGDRDAAWLYSLLQPSRRCPLHCPHSWPGCCGHAWALVAARPCSSYIPGSLMCVMLREAAAGERLPVA